MPAIYCIAGMFCMRIFALRAPSYMCRLSTKRVPFEYSGSMSRSPSIFSALTSSIFQIKKNDD